MTAFAKRPATYADLEKLPDNVVGELLGGELVVSPRPRPRHALSASGVTVAVGGAFGCLGGNGGPGGWWILIEPELRLAEHVLVPDVAGWRRDRVPTFADAAGITIAPDWVCEVLSPSTARTDRVTKMGIYARQGIPHLWMVSPDDKTLEAYALEHEHWLLLASHGGDTRARVPPFEAVEIDLAGWWMPEPEPAK